MHGRVWQGDGRTIGCISNAVTLLEEMKSKGVEGIVSKKKDSPYVPGLL